MKRIVCTVLAASAALGLLSGCAEARRDVADGTGNAVGASPTATATPLIVMPDPDNGKIEDGNGTENGTYARPTRSPAGTASPSPMPETGKRG